jgi:O-antigen/teichoic acid export membrane protein
MKMLAGANRSLAANAGSLLGSTAITSGLGFVYWWVAARSFAPEEVGFATSCISAMALISTVCASGTGSFLIGELARRARRQGTLIVAAGGIAGAIAAAGGLLFVLVGPLIASGLASLREPRHALGFAAGAAVVTFGLVLDQAAIGLLRGQLQLTRNAAWAVVKLGFLAALPWLPVDHNGFGVYMTWTAGCALSLLVFLLPARSPARKTASPASVPGSSRRRAFLAHNAANLALQAPGLCLPLLVTGLLSVTTTAYFYIAWTLAGIIFVLPVALSTSLFAVAAREPEALAARLRFSLGLAFAGGIAANLAIAVAGAPLLGAFGSGYSGQAALVLSILCLAVFPMAIKHHYLALARVRTQLRQATLVLALSGLLEIVLATAGARFGVAGLSAGWLLANVIQACLMAPALVGVTGLAWRPAWRNWRIALVGQE